MQLVWDACAAEKVPLIRTLLQKNGPLACPFDTDKLVMA
jgi:hypothetical protein